MPVLTKKQYAAEKKASTELFHISPKDAGTHTAGATANSAPAVPCFEYVLMYPEIPVNGFKPSFDGIADIEGKRYLYRCESGLIRTKEKSVCDFLVMQRQHILLEKKELKGA